MLLLWLERDLFVCFLRLMLPGGEHKLAAANPCWADAVEEKSINGRTGSANAVVGAKACYISSCVCGFANRDGGMSMMG